MPSKIIRKGKGLKKVLADLQPGYVTVGIHRREGKHRDSDLTIAKIAAINEFGIGVPERSFFRSTLFEQKKTIKLQIRKGAKNMFHNKKFNVHIRKLGEFVRGKIQAKIHSNLSPVNSPATRKGKGGGRTLVDKGQMVQSVHSLYHKKRP